MRACHCGDKVGAVGAVLVDPVLCPAPCRNAAMLLSMCFIFLLRFLLICDKFLKKNDWYG
jgi:hypothetical protein